MSNTRMNAVLSLCLAASLAALPGAALAGGTGLDASAPNKEQLFGKFNGADSNKDTSISEQEWIDYLDDVKNAPDFEKLDADKNGRIDESEWQKNYQKSSADTGERGGKS